MTVKIDSSGSCGCCKKPCAPKGPNPDQLISEAVCELKTKLDDLGSALRLAFARNARLGATRTFKIGGKVDYTPKINEPDIAPKTHIVNITGGK